MNHSKLLRMDLARPVNQRRHVSPCDIQDSIVSNRMAANYRHIRALVEIDIAPKLEAMRLAQDIMDRVETSFETRKLGRNFGVETEPSHRYSFGTMEKDYTGDNDSFASVRQQASERAFNHTQSTAGGTHASD